MKSRIVDLASLSRDDTDRWRDLLDRALDPYPFLDPRMIVASLPHMPLAREMRVIFVEDADVLMAVMPFSLVRLPERPHLRAITTRTPYLDDQGGWDHPLVDAAHAEAALDGLFRALPSLGLPRTILFASLPLGGDLERALIAVRKRALFSMVELERTEFVYASRSAEADTPDSGQDEDVPVFALPHLSSRITKDLARRAEGLARELNVSLRVEDRSGSPSAIREFIELQSSGWKGDVARGGEGIRVRGEERWFLDVTDRYRADGDLLVFALVAGSTVLHMRVSTRIRDDVFGWHDAYDERYAEYRPGVLGRVASMNRIMAMPGVHTFDPNFHPSTGDAKRIFPDRRERARVLVASGSALERALVAAIPSARMLKRSTKRILRRG